jgi:hypothetical protein
MASLKTIMNLDEEVDSRSNKKDKDSSGTPSGNRPPSQHRESSTSATNSSYATQGEQLEVSSTAQGKRRSSSRGLNKSSAAGSSSSSSSRPTTARRRSNTSTDSMDQPPYGSGHGGPSSSGGLTPSNAPMRPFAGMQAGGDQLPVKLTPITGRVSRARKGVPVHTCDVCRPPKVSYPGLRFLAPELLLTSADIHESRAPKVSSSSSDIVLAIILKLYPRRHQLSHQQPGYPCTVPDCGRSFHRKDLLERHQQRQ